MLGARVHPVCLVMVGKAEQDVCDEKAVGGAELKEELAVAVVLAQALVPQHFLPRQVVSADQGYEVTEKDELVCPRQGRDGTV